MSGWIWFLLGSGVTALVYTLIAAIWPRIFCPALSGVGEPPRDGRPA